MTEIKDAAEFNDDELQEIMGEIESLEESFGEEASSDTDSSGSGELDLKEAERQLAELEADLDHIDEAVHVAEEVATEEDNVVLGAQGPMNLNLNFSVARQEASLKIEGSSLVVELEGVHFHISEEHGCVFEMPGGVRFQVPLGSKGNISKAS